MARALAPSAAAFLAQWDAANRQRRRRLLDSFVAENEGLALPQLEERYGAFLSLLQTRILSSLRLSYSSRFAVRQQLRALRILIAAAAGGRLAEELVEAGSVPVLLEMIRAPALCVGERGAAADTLLALSRWNRRYMEEVVQGDGIALLCELAAADDAGEALETVRTFLLALGAQSARAEAEVHEQALVLLRLRVAGRCKRMASQVLLELLRGGGGVRPDAHYVEAAAALFHENDLRLHHEAFHLLQHLSLVHGLVDALVSCLAKLLRDAGAGEVRAGSRTSGQAHDMPGSSGRASANDEADQEEGEAGSKGAATVNRGTARGRRGSTVSALCPPAACAARLIAELAPQSPEFCARISAEGVVRPLLEMLGNAMHFDSQHCASAALSQLQRLHVGVRDELRALFGDALLARFLAAAATLHQHEDLAQEIAARVRAADSALPASANSPPSPIVPQQPTAGLPPTPQLSTVNDTESVARSEQSKEVRESEERAASQRAPRLQRVDEKVAEEKKALHAPLPHTAPAIDGEYLLAAFAQVPVGGSAAFAQCVAVAELAATAEVKGASDASEGADTEAGAWALQPRASVIPVKHPDLAPPPRSDANSAAAMTSTAERHFVRPDAVVSVELVAPKGDLEVGRSAPVPPRVSRDASGASGPAQPRSAKPPRRSRALRIAAKVPFGQVRAAASAAGPSLGDGAGDARGSVLVPESRRDLLDLALQLGNSRRIDPTAWRAARAQRTKQTASARGAHQV